MNDFQQKLDSLRKSKEKLTNEIGRNELLREQAEKKKAELVAALKEQGVDVDSLPAEIERLDKQIETAIAEAQKVIGDAEQIIRA